MPLNPVLLELRNITKRHAAPGGQPLEVLSGIDLETEAGESLAVLGPSGCGKSTLLNIIGALDRPSTGEVMLEGRDLAKLSERELAAVRNRKVGFVFQLHHLLPQCTILENVLIPTLAGGASDADDPEGRARDLLRHVGLEDRLTHRPGQLSGGECQRVAVVRALINRPRLLLADEPTGSLDRASAGRLAELLVELNRRENVTLIVVTHALELASQMGRVFEMRDGKLARS